VTTGGGPPRTRRSSRTRRRARRALVTGALGALVIGGLLWLGVEELRRVRAERRAWPHTTGSVVVAGLVERAVAVRDARGVPHVEAASEADALRVLGFLHAQDRLRQMLWLRRAARGRTAEVLGREGLAADRRARLLGIGSLADAAAERLGAEERRLLEAYAEGVNARLEGIAPGEAPPPEPPRGMPAAEPPWRPADSLALLKLHAWALGGALDASLVLDDVVRHLGGLESRPFFPEGAGIDATPYGTRARAPAGARPPARARARAAAGGPGDPLRRVAGLSGRGLGSSAWVVGGRHTASGRPLLAADLHVEARVPGLFYEAHLSVPEGAPGSRGSAGSSAAEGLDVAGATIPGLPLFWVGRNRHVAWAAVHARALTTDLYIETLHPDDYPEGWREPQVPGKSDADPAASADPDSPRELREPRKPREGRGGRDGQSPRSSDASEPVGAGEDAGPSDAAPALGRYHDGRSWRPLDLRRETIPVRGAPDVTLHVPLTTHGPLVNPVLDAEGETPDREAGSEGGPALRGTSAAPGHASAPDGGREAISLAWTGAHTGPGVAGLLAVSRARDAGELRRALAAHREPVVAVVYADHRGEAGVKIAGWLPRRELPSGLLPVPGRAPGYAWRSPVSPDRLPGLDLEDGQGWLVAADNRLPGAEGLGVEWLWQTGERAARIDALLARAARGGRLDVRDLAAIQGDLRSGRSGRIVRDALALLARGPEPDAAAAEMAERLESWDGRSGAESAGAAVYHVFLQNLLEVVLAERLGPDLAQRYLALDHPNPVKVAAEALEAAVAAGAGAPPRSPGWGDPERLAAAVQESLRSAWLHLSVEIGPNRSKWAWGRIHPLLFRPGVPGLGDPVGPFPLGGDALAVATAAYDHTDPFGVQVVAAYRFVADLGEPGYALSSLAPGPSEHPGHPHRTSGLERWLAGRPGLLATSALLVEESAVERLVLEPREAREPAP